MLKFKFLFVFFLLSFGAFAQNEDPVLFTVGSSSVTVSEFDYIYSKNTGKKTDYSEESLKEYLDLYVKFKLKVQRARDLKLDTIPSLIKELDGYRQQLAKSYLTDKEVTNRLIEEVYSRSQNDVKLSHLLVSLPQNANSKKEKAAKDKIMMISKEIKNGLSFDDAVQKYSEDKISKESKGQLGYLNSMFPPGFYELENAAYSLKVGEVSEPLRTKLGYHIVRVDDIRDARGEVEVAHILIRKEKKRGVTDNSKNTIDSIYIKLQGGADFGELARKYSQDKASAKNGGYIGLFGINKYEEAFENTAFGLTEDNSYSMPVETSVGWHILKRISVKPEMSYEDSKKRLKALVTKDPRHKIAKASLIQRIKDESDFTENKAVLSTFTSTLDKTFYSYKWKPSELKDEPLFAFGNYDFGINDFVRYAKDNTRTRLRMDDLEIDEAVEQLYTEFVEAKAIEYEEKQLTKKYPDFRAIMREYDEGILLFEVTKMNVWDKASLDTVGLEAYYERNRDKYVWKERANVQEFTLNTTDEELIAKFMKKAKRKSPEWLKNKFGDIFTVNEAIYERGSRDVSGIKFSKNSLSSQVVDKRKSTTKFKKIVSTMPIMPKTLKEARGYIEADYQDELEKKWVSQLRLKYDVKINEDVLKTLVK